MVEYVILHTQQYNQHNGNGYSEASVWVLLPLSSIRTPSSEHTYGVGVVNYPMFTDPAPEAQRC